MPARRCSARATPVSSSPKRRRRTASWRSTPCWASAPPGRPKAGCSNGCSACTPAPCRCCAWTRPRAWTPTPASLSFEFPPPAPASVSPRRLCLSLLTLKPGLFTAQGRDAAGEVWFDDLGAAPAPKRRRRGCPGRRRPPSGGSPLTRAATAMSRSSAVRPAWPGPPCWRPRPRSGRRRAGLRRPLDGSIAPLDLLRPELMFRRPEALDLGPMTVVCGCGGGSAGRRRAAARARRGGHAGARCGRPQRHGRRRRPAGAAAGPATGRPGDGHDPASARGGAPARHEHREGPGRPPRRGLAAGGALRRGGGTERLRHGRRRSRRTAGDQSQRQRAASPRPAPATCWRAWSAPGWRPAGRRRPRPAKPSGRTAIWPTAGPPASRSPPGRWRPVACPRASLARRKASWSP